MKWNEGKENKQEEESMCGGEGREDEVEQRKRWWVGENQVIREDDPTAFHRYSER
jgi:hypothetical protein